MGFLYFCIENCTFNTKDSNELVGIMSSPIAQLTCSNLWSCQVYGSKNAVVVQSYMNLVEEVK